MTGRHERYHEFDHWQDTELVLREVSLQIRPENPPTALLIIDCDDTALDKCFERHHKLATVLARRFYKHEGELPSIEETLKLGSAQAAFRGIFPTEMWGERLRKRQWFNELPPMIPDFPRAYSQLAAAGLQPTAYLTARPRRLEQPTRQLMHHYTQADLPVIAMPESLPLSQTAAWKMSWLKTLSTHFELPVVLIDDSNSVKKAFQAQQTPGIHFIHYSQNGAHSEVPVATWPTLLETFERHIVPHIQNLR